MSAPVGLADMKAYLARNTAELGSLITLIRALHDQGQSDERIAPLLSHLLRTHGERAITIATVAILELARRERAS